MPATANVVLQVLEEGTFRHTLTRVSGVGGPLYTYCVAVVEAAQVAGVDNTPLSGPLPRAKVSFVVDALDQRCNEGQAVLEHCDDEWLADFRWGNVA